MSFQVAGHQTEAYHVNTEIYEGPLDLLLQLIEHAELDITTLSLAKVTDQYLEHLEAMHIEDPAEVSAFLVIAARLVQIKSAALLPRQPALGPGPVEEDSGEELARQLIAYRRFKQLGMWLEQRDMEGLHTSLRLASPVAGFEARLDMAGLGIVDLVAAARSIFLALPNLPALGEVVSIPRITIRERIHVILDALRKAGRTSFSNTLDSRSRMEIVVTFLALLELIKRHVVEVEQGDLFSEIQVSQVPQGENTGEWNEEQEGELEFGE
jgi:segregation and condensation protein A